MRELVTAAVMSSASVSSAVGGGAAADFVLRDGFGEGLKNWQAHVGNKGGTVVRGVDADSADGKALLFDHRKTDTSRICRWYSFTPNTHHMCSLRVKSPEYLRVGMGLWVAFYSGDVESSRRWVRKDIGTDNWTNLQLPVLTDHTGKGRLDITLRATAGRLLIDSVTVRECSPAEIAETMGTGYDSPLPKSWPDQDEAITRIWYGEFPVTDRGTSHIGLQTTANIKPELWKKSGKIMLEVPAALKAAHITDISKERDFETLDGGYKRYAFTADEMYSTNKDWILYNLIVTSGEGLDFEGDSVRVFAVCDGYREEPKAVPIVRVKVPIVRQPKHIITGTTAYGHTLKSVPDYYNFVRSLGFNVIDGWGLSAEVVAKYHAVGIAAGTENSGMSTVAPRLGNYPDSFAVGFNGKERNNVICPSKRGGAYADFIDMARNNGKSGFTIITFDDEHHRDWLSTDTCVCDACDARWKQWLAGERPDVAYVHPAEILGDPINNREQYDQWFLFRAAMVREWYVEARRVFLEEVRKKGASNVPEPFINSYTGPADFDHIVNSSMNPAIMVGVFDHILPMFYGSALQMRTWVRELVAATDPQTAGAALCAGESRANRYEWQKGDVQAQMLESLFANGKAGILFWSWPYSNMRIVAEIAETNGVIADNEDIFWPGTPGQGFSAPADGQFASTLETDSDALLLVSNYTEQRETTVMVKRSGEAAVAMKGLLGSADLVWKRGESEKRIPVPVGNVRLWRWSK